MKQIKFGIILNYLSIVVTFIVGLIYTPYLIQNLGQSNYGIYALAFSIAGFLSILDMGIGNSIVRYIAANTMNGDKQKESKLIGFFFRLFSLIGVITFAIAIILALNIDKIVSDSFSQAQSNDLKWMIFILGCNFALGFVFNTFSAVIQAYERYIFLKVWNIIRSVLTPIISVIFLFYSADLVGLTTIILLVNIVVLLIHYIYYKKTLKIKMTFSKLDVDFKKEIFAYSSIIFLVAIADKLYWQIDQVLLGILKSPEDVAVYAVAIQFINIFMSLSLAITNVFLPKITKFVSEENYDNIELNKLYIKVSEYQAIIVGLALSGFVVLGRPFIILWVGEEYILVYSITIILITVFFVELIQNLGLTVMQAKGQYKFRAYVLIIFSLLNVFVSIPIIKVYGPIGTAYITALFIFLGNIVIMNFYFHRKVGLDMVKYWKKISRIITIIIIIITISYLFLGNIAINNWIGFFFAGSVHLFIYLLMLFILYLSKNQKSNCILKFKKFIFRGK